MEFILNSGAPTTADTKHWKFCVGSCHAPLAHRVDYLEQLKFVHDELGIERVRFHGLFSDDMNVGMTLHKLIPLPPARKFKEYSFYQIGRIYDNVLATGVKPFVELSFMPKILAKGKGKCLLSYKGTATMPKDLTEWSHFIGEFVSFLVDRYGAAEVSEWYFEVWNEPNLSAFFKGSQKDYFKLYEASARAIKAVNPNIRVGGPSTAACGWVQEFVDYCKAHDVPYDFVSTHQYPGEALGHSLGMGSLIKDICRGFGEIKKSEGGGVLDGARLFFKDKSTTANWDRDIFARNAATLKTIVGDKPLCFTEWNISATCTAPVNDSIRVAAYIAKMAVDLNNIADKTAFFCFSDIFEELLFFPDAFSGSFGLLNIYGIPKPSFYAFKLLSMLGDTRYITDTLGGQTELCAFQKEDELQLLLYRQDFTAESGVPTEVSVKIPCPDKPSAIVAYKINETHCNARAVWQAMGSPKYLKPQDVQAIKDASALKGEPLPVLYNGGVLTVKTSLVPNEVQLICISNLSL